MQMHEHCERAEVTGSTRLTAHAVHKMILSARKRRPEANADERQLSPTAGEKTKKQKKRSRDQGKGKGRCHSQRHHDVCRHCNDDVWALESLDVATAGHA